MWNQNLAIVYTYIQYTFTLAFSYFHNNRKEYMYNTTKINIQLLFIGKFRK